MLVGGQRKPPADLHPGKRPGTHCTGAGWAPGPVWTGAKNLTHTNMNTVINGFCIEFLPRIMEDDIL